MVLFMVHLGSTENFTQDWLFWLEMDFDGSFWVVLKILDQMGSAILVMDFNGPFDFVMVDFR